MALRDIVLWPVRQVRGFIGNVVELTQQVKPDSLLPPSVVSTIEWVRAQIPRALGFGSPAEQMTASVVLIITSILTSLFSGGITLFFVAVFAVTFLLGAFRLWPVVNQLWPVG